MTFKTLLTAALLTPALTLGGPVFAQEAVPALPPTAQPPVAQPPTALPPTAQPPATPADPGSPPVSPPPAEPAAPAVLLLTAAPGTYAEYAQTSVKLLSYRLEAQPGKTVKPADLAAANQKLQGQRAQIETALGRTVNAQASKLFMKVLPPKNGNTQLLYTSVLNLPDPANPKKQTPATVGVTLTYTPAGQLIDASVATQDPTLAKVYKALDLPTLLKSVQGTGTTSYYGLPLVPEKASVTSTTVPMQGFIQGLTSVIAGGASVPGSAQASPLTMKVSTTYTGTDAQGNLLFTQSYSADPWNVSLNIRDLKLDMKVIGLSGNTSSVLRPDGFPRSSQMTQDISVQMQLNLPGEPYRLVMALQYGTKMTVTPKP